MGNEQLSLLLLLLLQLVLSDADIYICKSDQEKDKEGNTSIEEEIYGEKGPEKNSS